MGVHKRARAEKMVFAGVELLYVELLWHTGAPGYMCNADTMPDFLETSYDSPLGKSELQVFGKISCGPNCKQSDGACTIEVLFNCVKGGFSSWVVCKDWAKAHLPDLYYKIFPEEKIEPIRLNLRKPVERTGPINAYGLTQGETADDNLRLLSEQIGNQFVREMALARRVNIDELLKVPVSRAEPEPVTLGRGDSIPWWIRKGYSEPPMSHEM